MIETLTHAKPIASAATSYLPIEEHGVIGDLRSVALVGTDGTIDWYCPVRFDAPSVFCGPARQGARRLLPHRACARRLEVRPRRADAAGRGRPALRLRARGARGCGGRERRGLPLERRLPRALDPRAARSPGRPRRRRADRRRARAGDLRPGERRRRASPAAVRRGRGQGPLHRDDRLLAKLAQAVTLHRALARDGRPLGAHAQAPHLPADRSHRRRADHEPSGAAGRRAKLGLPVHLDPRRLVLPLRAPPPRLHRRGRRLRRLARRALPDGDARGVRAAADHVRDRRQSRARGADPRPPRGLPRLGARSDRQRRRDPAPARHLRRARRLDLPLQQARAADLARRLGGSPPHRRLGLGELGPGRRGRLGDAGRAPALHLRAPDVVGGGRAGDQDRTAARAPGRPHPLDGRARRDLHAGHDPRLARGARCVRPALRHRRVGRVRSAHAAREVHLPDRPALALDARPDGQGARLRLARLPVQRSASPDGLEGEEGTFSICSFWYVEALTRAGRLDEARIAFEKMLTYANHLGLYSEEIGPTGEALGNFPQAFTHLSLISAATNLDRQLG